jgi:hypothetical protein
MIFVVLWRLVAALPRFDKFIESSNWDWSVLLVSEKSKDYVVLLVVDAWNYAHLGDYPGLDS